MFTKRVQARKMNGEGFAFFRWHCLRYWEICDGLANDRNLCAMHWIGNVR